MEAQAMCLPWRVALHGGPVTLRVTDEANVNAPRKPLSTKKRFYNTLLPSNICTINTAVPHTTRAGQYILLYYRPACAEQKHQ